MSLLALPATLPTYIASPPLAATGAAQVIIGGATVPLQKGSLHITRVIGQRNTGSLIVNDTGNAFRFKQGQSLYVYDGSGKRAFSGVVTDDSRARSPKGGDVQHTVSFADWHYLADKKAAPYSAQNMTLGAIANALMAQFLASEGVTAGVIQTGPLVVSFLSGYGTVAQCFDALVQKAGDGWYWLIDDDKRLQVQVRTSAPLAPFVATEDIMEIDSIVPIHGNANYANTVYMLGGVAQTSAQTETRKGDGATTAFLFSYPISSISALTVNGVAQTIGVQGVDTSKQWYYTPGQDSISQDSSGTKLTNLDTLSITYIGQFPNVTKSADGAAISKQQLREGAGSGVVEAAVVDATLTTTNQAFQSAAGYLSKYAQDLDSITFATHLYGLLEGQLLTVDVPPDDFNNEQMLIEQIDITDSGPYQDELDTLWYTVKAVSGPINTGWQAFFKALASQQNAFIDSIQVGQAQTLALLEADSVAFSWSVTGTATVNTLLIPQTTLYPSTTLYPGTAGTPTAISWQKTNAGLDAIRDVLSGANMSGLPILYFAWGTGTQGSPTTATQLAAEVGRKAITSIANGTAHGEEIITEYLSPQDANVAISEVAIFAGASASASTNSGTMLLYGLYAHTKTNLESLQFSLDSVIS